MGYSALNVRYAARHAKDDYKHAAALAATELFFLAAGAYGGWRATRGALYYGVPYAGDQTEWRQKPGEGVQSVDEKKLASLTAQEAPTLVLLSRTDSYDQQGIVGNYLSVNKYRLVETFPAFTAWRP